MIDIRELSVEDGKDIYEMLQTIEENENEFTNPVKKMNYEQYKEWLKLMKNWSEGKELEKGYVPQTIYWLFNNDEPIGIGKIRHRLTDATRKFGGNIGYALSNKYRGKGYGTIFLNELLKKADELDIDERILTVEKFNYPSKRVIEKNGGKVIEENEKRWILRID